MKHVATRANLFSARAQDLVSKSRARLSRRRPGRGIYKYRRKMIGRLMPFAAELINHRGFTPQPFIQWFIRDLQQFS
jgi:hypothetical protein